MCIRDSFLSASVFGQPGPLDVSGVVQEHAPAEAGKRAGLRLVPDQTGQLGVARLRHQPRAPLRVAIQPVPDFASQSEAVRVILDQVSRFGGSVTAKDGLAHGCLLSRDRLHKSIAPIADVSAPANIEAALVWHALCRLLQTVEHLMIAAVEIPGAAPPPRDLAIV